VQVSIGNWKQSGAKTANKTLQLTQKASFVLCITLRSIFAQNKGHFSVS
jgi:hypothetical protein